VAAPITTLTYAQDWISNHREDEARWAKKTGLSTFTIHRLWRSTSHFADEQDDDSQIELLDVTSLSQRNQILLVTSAGEPRCLTLTVFSKAAGFLKVWNESQTPDGHGFCENLGIPARFKVSERAIEVVVARERLGPRSSHADVAHFPYHWTGKTYFVGEKQSTTEFIPQR